MRVISWCIRGRWGFDSAWIERVKMMEPDRHFRYCQRTSERNSCSSTHDDALTLLSPSVVIGSQRELAEAQLALRESRTLNRRRSVCVYIYTWISWMTRWWWRMGCSVDHLRLRKIWHGSIHLLKVCVNKRKEEKKADVNRIESCYRYKNDLSKLTLGRTLKVHTSFVSAQYSPPHLRHPELLSVMAWPWRYFS